MTSSLLANIIEFCAILRQRRIAISPSQSLDLAEALNYIDPSYKIDFYLTLRCILIKDPNDYPVFHESFSTFWTSQRKQWKAIEMPGTPMQNQSFSIHEQNKNHSSSDAEGDQSSLLASQTFSSIETLKGKDFSDMSSEEKINIFKLIKEMDWNIDKIKTRRISKPKGDYLDFSSTLKESLRHQSEIMTWKYKQPSTKTRSIVILADVSGSMEIYSDIILRVMHALSHGMHVHLESFVFSTFLARISRMMRIKSADKALYAAARSYSGWSGGTDIGKSLKEFNLHWKKRVLKPSSVVLIVSDGWDRGIPGLIEKEISRLQLNCHRLIWLNPNLGSPDYKPLTQGMAAALPYIDDFLPVNNFNSIENLVQILGKILPRRTVKLQTPSSYRTPEYA